LISSIIFYVIICTKKYIKTNSLVKLYIMMTTILLPISINIYKRKYHTILVKLQTEVKKIMNFLTDEGGQGAAEYILLFGGVIVIAIAALLIYRAYFNSTNPYNAASDINRERGSM
jgi:dolichol kinase